MDEPSYGVFPVAHLPVGTRMGVVKETPPVVDEEWPGTSTPRVPHHDRRTSLLGAAIALCTRNRSHGGSTEVARGNSGAQEFTR